MSAILEESGGGYIRVYLHSFGVDKHALLADHKRWLQNNIIRIANADQAKHDHKKQSTPESWDIWLCGTTSRTASQEHNLKLSKRRANAVADYLTEELNPLVVYSIDTTWVGEILTALKGVPDEFEDPLDRAVLLAFRVVKAPKKKPVQPPKKKRPQKRTIPCCYAKQLLEYYEAVYYAWMKDLTFSGKEGGGAQLDKIDPNGDIKGHNRGYSEPQTSVDPNWLAPQLRNKGWSYERAWELATDGPLTSAPVTQKERVISDIGRDIESIKKLKLKCTKDDPDNFCNSKANTLHY